MASSSMERSKWDEGVNLDCRPRLAQARPLTMRAVICREWGPIDSLTIADVPAPKPGAGDVLITVKATAVNYADALLVAGQYQTKPALPFSPGLETAGIVAACGEGVTRFTPGDRVLLRAAFTRRRGAPCR